MTNLKTFRDGTSDFLGIVKTLVCDELNCECPVQVFEQIRILRGEASPGKGDLALVVGERLLVLFVKYENIEPFDFEIPRLILAGITYRDSIGLNRFRLILEGPVTDENRALVNTELAKYDDRVHVHYFE